MKRILFAIILILSSFLFGCNKNLDISPNNNEENNYSISNSDLSEYREEIEELYIELKFNYEHIKENKNLNEWVEFKSLFDNKIYCVKEKVSNTKLKYSIENLENLYIEYDKELHEII